MGNSRYDSNTFRTYSQTNQLHSRSDREVFSSRLHESLDPKNIRVRESRDSEANPLSTAIGIFGDHTGSMGHWAGKMLREGVDKVMRDLYEHRPVTDPHILFGLFGDALTDHAPLEASQFEADIRIVEQLRLAYLEGNGGGNGGESGTLPWYFMAHYTAIDCWEKRQKKGYLFTYSDEPVHDTIPTYAIQRIFGSEPRGPLDGQSLYRAVSEKYEVFHLVVGTGYSDALPSWRRYLGERAIQLANPETMPEVIAGIIQANEGQQVTSAAAQAVVQGLGRRIQVS